MVLTFHSDLFLIDPEEVLADLLAFEPVEVFYEFPEFMLDHSRFVLIIIHSVIKFSKFVFAWHVGDLVLQKLNF